MTDIKCIEFDDLTKEEIDSLWDQGVSMDDWDYILLVSPDHLEGESWFANNTTYSPKSYSVERMLTGCFDNQWHVVDLRGERWGLGIAYHS